MLRAIGGADERLIEEALEVRAKRKPAVLRWVAVAACVCLLLASPVGASVVGMLKETVGQGNLTAFYIDEHFKLMDFSEEVRAAAAGQEKIRGFYPVDDFEAAEVFLGLEFPENDVISNALPKDITLDEYSGGRLVETYVTPCLVDLTKNDANELVTALTWAEFALEDGCYRVHYFAATEESTEEIPHMIHFDKNEADRENYVTAAGYESVIFSEFVDYGFGSWEADAVLAIDKYIVVISVYEWSEGEAMTVLKSILDAYG